MWPLLRKEMLNLRALFWLVVVLQSADAFTFTLAGRPDEYQWALEESIVHEGGGAYAVLLVALCLSAAYSLFPREHDERTIEFLQSLPVHPAAIFASKFLAAFVVMAIGVVIEGVVCASLQCFNPNSIEAHQFRLSIAVPATMLGIAYCGIVLCHGMFMSFFRSFGLLAYGVLLMIYAAHKQVDPALRMYDPTSLLDLQYRGQTVLVPWSGLEFHLALGGVLLAASYLLWSVPAERLAGLLRHPLVRFAMTASAVVGGVLALAAVGKLDQSRPPAEVSYPDSAQAVYETAHYRFTYPVRLRDRSLQLISDADGIYQKVGARLGADGQGPHLVADLTDHSRTHAGITAGNKIRIGLTQGVPARTLAHETTHAFENWLTHQRLVDNSRATKFFNEGLAEYVAFEVTSPTALEQASHREAAAMAEREKVRFEDLADENAFERKYDETANYTLGEAWVRALVERYGAEAPGRVLRAMAREEAPQGLDAMDFWQDTLQACGYSLDAVVAAWQQDLKKMREQEAEWLKRLPHLRGGVRGVANKELVLEAQLDRPPMEPEQEFYVALRSGPDQPHPLWYVGTRKGLVVEFRVPLDELWGRGFEYQFEQSILAGFPLGERWKKALVPSTR